MRCTSSRSIAVAVGLTVALVGCAAPASPVSGDSSGAPRTQEASLSAYAALTTEPARRLRVFDQVDFAGFMVPDEKGRRLFSASPTGLGWVDPDTGATHVVDHVPGVYLAVYGDSLYRTAFLDNNVARYDISGEPREVARHQAPSPLNIIAGPQGVWASDHHHGNLLRLDPQTVRVVDKVKIAHEQEPGPAGLAWQGEDFWVNVQQGATLALADGRTGQALRSVHLDGVGTAEDISLTSAGLWVFVWVNDDTKKLELVDTQTLRIKARLDIADCQSMPVEVDGEVWLPVDDKLLHLDPDRGWQPDRVVDLGIPDLCARRATVGFGSVWISDNDHPRIVRVDLSNPR